MLSNATNQPKSTVELGYMCPRGLTGPWKILMLSKRYESTEVDRRTYLHVPSGTHWSTSSDTHQVVEIQIETSTKMYTPFLIGFN